MSWAHLALETGCWPHWEDCARYLLSASITQRVSAEGSSSRCAVQGLLISRLLVGKLPRHAQCFSSTLENHTKGCPRSPCLVATGLAVADATTLTSMQQWLLVPAIEAWRSGWYRLLQTLILPSHRALFGWVLHSLWSYFPFWSVLDLHSPCLHPEAVQDYVMTPPVFSSLVVKVEGTASHTGDVFLNQCVYVLGWIWKWIHWAEEDSLIHTASDPKRKGNKESCLYMKKVKIFLWRTHGSSSTHHRLFPDKSKFSVPIWLAFPCVPSPFCNTKKQDGVLT